MAKRKNKDPGRVRQLHPQRSFDEQVAQAVRNNMQGYVAQQVQQLGQALLQRQVTAVQNLFTRIVATEEIICENLEGVSKETLAEKVAAVQDRNEGFELVEGAVEKGDRVRLEIKTKTEDQEEYQGSSRMVLDNAGSGQTLGKELEDAVLGLTAGETKEVIFGKDGSLTASITINRVSRRPAPPVEQQENTEEPAPAATEEVVNESKNAG